MAFTTRRGGVSRGPFAELNLGVSTGDEPSAVRANRRRVAAGLGLDPGRISLVNQVHGRSVCRLAGPSRPGLFAGGLVGWPAADAMTTAKPGAALCVLGADCLPVLVWRRDGTCVGAAHAGWRGLVAGVVEATLESLAGEGPIAAAIGPGIGPCCYEVSADVRDRFAERFGPGVLAGKAVDLASAAEIALGHAGVTGEAIWRSGVCTSCDEGRFFSHRRDGPATGRQAGLIWIAAESPGPPVAGPAGRAPV